MSTLTRLTADDPDTLSDQLTRQFADPAVPPAKRIELVCLEMLLYTSDVERILADTRCSGPTTVDLLADHLDRAYHRAAAFIPEDVTRALAIARVQRGLIDATVLGAGTVTRPSAVELLQALHWKVHNFLLLIAGPSGRGKVIWQAFAEGLPGTDPVFMAEEDSIEALAGWFIAGRTKVVPIMTAWRAETERLAAEVRWERLAAAGGVPVPSVTAGMQQAPEAIPLGSPKVRSADTCPVVVSESTICLNGRPLGTLTPNECKVWLALVEAYPLGLSTPELTKRSQAAQPGRHVKDVTKKYRELKGYVIIPLKGKQSTPQSYRLCGPRCPR